MKLNKLPQIGFETLWILVVVSGVFIFINTQPIRPHDFWWHLALGREIAATHTIPSVDVYSFIMQGTPYPSYQMFWLIDVALYSMYNLGGPALVIFVQSLIVSTTYGLLLWLCWKQSNSTRIAAFSAIIAIALGINNWNVRPQTFSYLLGVLFLVAIYSFRVSGRKSWLIIPPLGMLVWVNSHGSFVIGLVLIGIWVGDELWQVAVDYYQKNERSFEGLWTSLILLGLTGLMCLVNPRGLGIVSYVRSLTGNAAVVNLVTEWAPPNFNNVSGIIFFTAFILVAVVLAVSPKRPNFFQLGTFVIFGILSLRTTRGVLWFGIVIAPILAEHLAELIDAIRREPEQVKFRKGNQVINWTLFGIIFAAILISLPWFKNSLPFPSLKAGLISAETPLKATQFLIKKQLPPDIFNEMGFGSYLIWAAYPDYQVFVDPRIELYPIETWWDYSAVGNALPGWQNLLDQYEIRTLMLSPENQAPIVAALRDSPDWILEYEDLVALIFTRKDR